MNLLYFGDFHHRKTKPENRIDDFSLTLQNKAEEILRLGKQYKVKAFLQPGDFWDEPNPPLDYAAEVIRRWTNIDVFQLLQSVINGESVDVISLQDYIPLVGVAGNHELFGNNIKTLPKTMLGFMNQLGLMKFATKENPYFLTTEDGLKVAITGSHYHLGIDHPESIDDYIVEEKLGDVHIHIVHGYLTDRGKGTMFRHTVVDAIRETKADLTLSGHDHIGFPIQEIDGKYFVNPGAVVRLSNDLKEMNRKVNVLLLGINQTGITVNTIPLQSAITGSAVLSRAKITAKKQKEARLEEFKRTIREAGIKKSTSMTEIIQNLADNRHLSASITKDVLDRVANKAEEIQSSSDGVVEEAYVTKIVLENFQSHVYTELDCSTGFNLFVGESHQGKSAVLRAFRWVYENKPNGKRIIHAGKEYAKVSIQLSNGYVVTRILEAKRGGKNGYEITDPNTGEVTIYNTKILPEVQKLLGFSLLAIDKDLQYNLNFSKQGSGWFMIGDGHSSPERAKMIGGIYGTQYADAALRDLEQMSRRNQEKQKELSSQQAKVEEQIHQFDYLSSWKDNIELVEKKLQLVQSLQQRKEQVQQVIRKREQIFIKKRENETVLQQLTRLDLAQTIYENNRLIKGRRDQIAILATKMSKTQFSLRHIYRSLQELQHLDQVHQIWKNLQFNWEKRKRIEGTVKKFQQVHTQWRLQQSIVGRTNKLTTIQQQWIYSLTLQKERTEWMQKMERCKSVEAKQQSAIHSIKEIERSLTLTSDIVTAREQFQKIKPLQEIQKKVVETLRQWEKSNQLVQTSKRTLEEVAILMKAQLVQYQTILTNVGTCPVCKSPIDDHVIHRIIHQFQGDSHSSK